MTVKRKAADRPRLLIAEGADECHLAKAVLEKLGLQEVQVIDAEGKAKFAGTVQSIMKESGFEGVTHFGIMRDADNDPTAALQSTQHLLRTRGLPVPESAEAIASDSKRQVAIWLSPGNGATGMLEDLFIASLAEQPVHTAAHSFLTGLESTYPTGAADGQFSLSPNRQKSLAHACLMVTRSPLKSIGHAASAGYWNLDHPSMEPMRRFMVRLFA